MMCRFKGIKGEAGLSLIELVMALAVFSIVITAVATSTMSGMNITRKSKERLTASGLAKEMMESKRQLGFDRLTELIPAASNQVSLFESVSAGEVSYTVRTDIKRTVLPGFSARCEEAAISGGQDVSSVLGVTVVVTSSTGKDVHEMETFISPEDNEDQSGATKGIIMVSVIDLNEAPLIGAEVELEGGGTVITDATGCAIFPNLNPGYFDVTISKAPTATGPFYGPDGEPTISLKDIGVVAGKVSSRRAKLSHGVSAHVAVTTPGWSSPFSLPSKWAVAQWDLSQAKFSTAHNTTNGDIKVWPNSYGVQFYLGGCSSLDPGELRRSAVVVPALGSALQISVQAGIANFKAGNDASVKVTACGGKDAYTIALTPHSDNFVALPAGVFTVGGTTTTFEVRFMDDRTISVPDDPNTAEDETQYSYPTPPEVSVK